MQNELLPKAVELVELSRKDQFVQQAIMRVLSTRGLPSLGAMANEDPEAFEELYDACKTMVEELPWV